MGYIGDKWANFVKKSQIGALRSKMGNYGKNSKIRHLG